MKRYYQCNMLLEDKSRDFDVAVFPDYGEYATFARACDWAREVVDDYFDIVWWNVVEISEAEYNDRKDLCY